MTRSARARWLALVLAIAISALLFPIAIISMALRRRDDGEMS